MFSKTTPLVMGQVKFSETLSKWYPGRLSSRGWVAPWGGWKLVKSTGQAESCEEIDLKVRNIEAYCVLRTNGK